jgi:hypothetical protein
MKKVTDPALLSALNKPVTDPALLAQLNGPSDAAVQEAAFANKVKQELKDSGGVMANIGAGMNKTVQGVKQLFGQGGSDEDILARRKLDEQLAEGQTGGELLQLGGEMVASALPAGGAAAGTAKVLTKLPWAGKALAALGSKGGRVANVGTMGRGVAEGAAGSLLNETTSDESDLMNAALGGGASLIVPAVSGVGGKLVRTLSKKNAPNRAAKVFEKQLGPDDMMDIGHRVTNNPGTKLPLTTAAVAENPKLAALERGARGRNDAGYLQDRKVADTAWAELKGATGAADELTDRVADRELMMATTKQGMEASNHPTLTRRAANDVSDAAEALRTFPEVRQSPEVSRIIGEVEVLLQHPDKTAADFGSQYWRLNQMINEGSFTPEAKGALMKMRDAVQEAADTASGSPQFTDMLSRYKVEEGLVKGSESAKKIREMFVDEQGIPQTPRNWFGTPEVTSQRLRQAVSKHGADQYGSTLDDAARKQLNELEGELTRHEMYLPRNSSGESQLDMPNPLSVVSSGRDNPFNFLPLVKGGANWLLHGSRKATTEAADEAMMDPAAWKKMMEGYAASKSPLTPQEYAARIRRQLMLMPGRAGAAATGE